MVPQRYFSLSHTWAPLLSRGPLFPFGKDGFLSTFGAHQDRCQGRGRHGAASVRGAGGAGPQRLSQNAPRRRSIAALGGPLPDERIIHSLKPIQSSASRLTLPTEVPINANYNGDFSDMGTYSYRPSNSHHLLMTVSHYQDRPSLN